MGRSCARGAPRGRRGRPRGHRRRTIRRGYRGGTRPRDLGGAGRRRRRNQPRCRPRARRPRRRARARGRPSRRWPSMWVRGQLWGRPMTIRPAPSRRSSRTRRIEEPEARRRTSRRSRPRWTRGEARPNRRRGGDPSAGRRGARVAGRTDRRPSRRTRRARACAPSGVACALVNAFERSDFSCYHEKHTDVDDCARCRADEVLVPVHEARRPRFPAPIIFSQPGRYESPRLTSPLPPSRLCRVPTSSPPAPPPSRSPPLSLSSLGFPSRGWSRASPRPSSRL